MIILAKRTWVMSYIKTVKTQKKRKPFRIVIIKCNKISITFFAIVTVRKLKVFQIDNRAYLYLLLKY